MTDSLYLFLLVLLWNKHLCVCILHLNTFQEPTSTKQQG